MSETCSTETFFSFTTASHVVSKAKHSTWDMFWRNLFVSPLLMFQKRVWHVLAKLVPASPLLLMLFQEQDIVWDICRNFLPVSPMLLVMLFSELRPVLGGWLRDSAPVLPPTQRLLQYFYDTAQFPSKAAAHLQTRPRMLCHSLRSFRRLTSAVYCSSFLSHRKIRERDGPLNSLHCKPVPRGLGYTESTAVILNKFFLYFPPQKLPRWEDFTYGWNKKKNYIQKKEEMYYTNVWTNQCVIQPTTAIQTY